MRELILCSSRKYPQPPPALMEGDGNSEGKGESKRKQFTRGSEVTSRAFFRGLAR